MVDTFLYPRTATISRPAAQTGVGFQASYAADQESGETLVVSGIPCSIQLRREGQKSPTGLPADSTNPIWWLFIPLEAGLARDLIREKDVVTDDIGDRYGVVAAYYDSLGFRLSVETLAP